LDCRAERQRVAVGLVGRASVNARMGPPEVDVAAERSSRLTDAVVGPQIHLLVFDAAPEALEKHVVAPRAPAVHADRNLVLDQDVGEGGTRELAALGLSQAEYLEARTRPQDLSVSAAWPCDRSAEPGVGDRHHLRAHGARLRQSQPSWTGRVLSWRVSI